MQKYPYPYSWKELPGTTEEREFLGKRFAEMSVREQYLVEGVSRFCLHRSILLLILSINKEFVYEFSKPPEQKQALIIQP